MSRTFLFIFLFILLAPSILAQRGGGGRSGGGGGGRSGGGSFRSRSYGRSCQTKCMGNPACLQECRRSSTTAGIIIGSVFGGVSLCAFCAIIGSACHCTICCTSKIKYNQLKKDYNDVDTHSMPLQQFRMKRDRILYLINQSMNNDNFAGEQNNDKFYMKAEAQIIKEEDFITEIKLVGSDKIGAWEGKGFILCKDGTMFMWIYKEYNNREEAQQVGEWEHLVYKSTSYSDQFGMEGVWTFLGFQYSPQYSGKWKLWQPTM